METLAPLSAASVVVAVACYPVDVLRALKMSGAGGQSISPGQFYRKYGARGFFGQGMGPEVTRATVMRVSKFYFNPVMAKMMWGKKVSECTPAQKLLSGAFATFPEILAISPFEIAKLGLQTDTSNKFKNSMLRFLKHSYSTHGMAGLYSGWFGMQMRQCCFTGVYFASLSTFRQMYSSRLGLEGVPCNLAAGFSAGILGSICGNIPSDVTRSVVQKRVFAGARAYGISPKGIAEHISTAAEIFHTKGLRGLYVGTLFKASYLGAGMAATTVLIPFFSELMGIHYEMA